MAVVVVVEGVDVAERGELSGELGPGREEAEVLDAVGVWVGVDDGEEFGGLDGEGAIEAGAVKVDQGDGEVECQFAEGFALFG